MTKLTYTLAIDHQPDPDGERDRRTLRKQRRAATA